jgi:hypothetical protein
MNKTCKLVGMQSHCLCAIVLLVAIGLSMTACPTDDDGNNPSSCPLGKTLRLSGQVSLQSIDIPVSSAGFSDRSSAEQLNFIDIGGSGSVVHGQLIFTIDTPTVLESAEKLATGCFEELEGEKIFTDIRISPADTQGAILINLQVTGGKNALWRWNSVSVKNGASTIETQEFVYYIYVDRNATFTATGVKGSNHPFTLNVSDINISLEQGWNAIYSKVVGATAQSGGSINISADNPNHIGWVVMSY